MVQNREQEVERNFVRFVSRLGRYAGLLLWQRDAATVSKWTYRVYLYGIYIHGANT